MSAASDVTAFGLATDTLFVPALRAQADRYGDRPAMTFLDFDQNPAGTATTWSYAELDRRARAVAAELQRRHRPGDRAAVLCPHGLDYVAAFLGCLYAGVLAVPLYPPSITQPRARVAALLADTAPHCLLATGAVRDAVRPLLAGTDPPAGLLAVDEIDDGRAADWRPVPAEPDQVAYLQYTSGSTRRPTGVMVTQTNLSTTIRQLARAYQLGPHTVSGTWVPFFHDMGLATAVTGPLGCAGHAVTMVPLAFVHRPAHWLQLLSRYRATFTATPNMGLDLCVDRIDPAELSDVDLSSLVTLINGSEPVRARSLHRFSAAFSRYGFNPAAHSPGYGLAEATVLVSATGNATRPPVLDCDRVDLAAGRVRPVSGAWADPSAARRLVGCGTPVDQRIAIVDPDTWVELADDRVGEIWVHGPNVTAGYHHQPELTREVFGNRPHSDPGRAPAGARWLRTGDLGFRHDGQLYVTGRIKDLIIIGGRNHYPADIEATVEHADHRLRPDHVVAFSVDGENTELLVVVAETSAGGTRLPGPERAELLQAVRSRVAAEHGVAVHDLVLVRRGAIPKTSSGKLQRASCRQRYLAGDYPPTTTPGGGRP